MMKELVLVALLVAVVRGDHVTTPDCIEQGQDVTVGFEYDDNNNGDWIGLYPAANSIVVGDIVLEPQSRNWVWTCGSRSCNNFNNNQGPVMVQEPDLSGSTLWIAVLARFTGDAAPYTLVEKSAPFSIKSDCSAPDPTDAPVTSAPVPTVPTPPPTRDPTVAPVTRAPNPPTPPPTDQPPTHMDKSVYDFGERFSVDFEIDDPEDGDWVGIYNADTPLDSLNTAHYWLWVCDRQSSLGNNCGGRPSGTLMFREDKDIGWGSDWPLQPGNYKAVVMRNGNGPFQAIVATPAFTIETPTSMGELAVNFARHDIEHIIIGRGGDIALAAKFLRLGFHDCVGGCDGCVDLTFLDNRGLDIPIDALEPIWQKHRALFSRADIWAMATLVGTEVSQPRSGFRKDFPFHEFGRKDCEDVDDVCVNEHGDEHDCRTKRGPHRHIPGVNTGTRELFEFFLDEFGFNTRETVAIMGAHTIGQLARENSGIGGEDGWVAEDNLLLDNEYYIELVGGDGPDDSVQDLVQGAPNWLKHFESNSDQTDFPDKHVWLGLPGGQDGKHIIMLNTDIAIVRDLNDDNMDPDTGRVDCNFVDRSNTRDPTCPHAKGALQEAARYRFSNRAWIIDFEDTLIAMLSNGYSVDDGNCNGDFCPLVRV